MFVVTKRSDENLNYFIYDSPLPTGNISERFVDPLSECFVNPKGNGRIH